MNALELDSKGALISLSQFVFRKEADELREGLYDGLVQLAIFLSGSEGLSSSEIQGVISKQYSKIQLHQSFVDDSVRRLVRNRTIFQRRYYDRYRLYPEARKSLSNQIDERKNQIEKISNQVIEKVKSEYTQEIKVEDLDIITKKFFLILSKIIIPRGKVSAALLTGIGTEIPENLQIQNALKETLKDVPNLDLKMAINNAIFKFFQEMNDETAKFLFDISENIFLLEVLNLDPECQSLQRIEFSKISLFLDTNVVMSLICSHDPKRKSIASEFAQICSSLGINLYVTNQTMIEYNYVLDCADKNFKEIDIPARFLRDYDDSFIASYVEELQQSPAQTWEGYYLRMKKLGGDFENKFKASRFKENREEILQFNFFKEVADKVSECSKIHRGSKKNEPVSNHDAYHLLLVRELRKGVTETIFGPKTWFASLDNSLICVDKFIDNYYDDKTPSTMNCDVWIQMMAPFMSSDVREQEMCEIFASLISSQFLAARDRINYEKLKIIQGEWLNYSRLNENDLREILATQFVENYIGIVTKLTKEEKEIPNELKQDFEKQLDVKIDEILNRKIEKIENEVRQKEIEIKKLEKQAQQIEESSKTKIDRTKTFWRQIAGILGIILAGVNILFMYSIYVGQTALTTYSIPYILGSWLVTCILLMIAIAYDQIQVVLKMIWDFSKGGK
jgi:hypothetical protein